MTTLIIVESPTKAEKFQKYLGKEYIVLASKGHITDLAKGGKYQLGIDFNNNYEPKYVLLEDKVKTLNALLAAAKTCDQILIASDPDREGEAIAWHLWQRLKDTDKPIKRFTFKEITKKAILSGIQNSREVDLNLFHAQEARRILDRIVGFKVSPFLMNIYKQTLSAGRVQSVVTRMIIDREKQIDSFVPEDFWTIQTKLKDNKNNEFFAKYEYKITDQKTADQLEKDINTCGKFTVKDVVDSEEKKAPPAPLVTSSLQQIMSKQFGVPADRTMKAAQSLYENGFCTYIRTDSTRIEEDALASVRDYIKNNKYDLPKKANVYKNKDASQDAHECIRPTDINIGPDNYEIASPDEKKAYEIIWKTFVASQMTPAIYSTLKVTLVLDSDPEITVKASGKAIKDLGFMKILGGNTKDKIEIPNLQVKDKVNLSGKAKNEKKQTQPAARYSESDLIKELEKKEIGRPATYAEILSKICSRNYVEKKGNVYHPTDLGKQITNMLVKHFPFMDYNYTADMEKKLDLISLGKLDHKKMIDEFYTPFSKQLTSAYVSNGTTMCKNCGSAMVTRKTKDGNTTFLGCSNFPKCKTAIFS
jgi:DNA topoisomerase-1